MSRATLIRVLLAVVLATASGIHEAQSQSPQEPSRPQFPGSSPGGPGDSGNSNNNVWWIVGGVAAGLLGLAIGRQLLTNPGASDQPAPPRLLPYEPPLVQLPTDPLPRLRQGGGTGAGGAGTGGPGTGSSTTAALRRGFDLPPPGVPHVLDEVMLDISANSSTLDAIATTPRHDAARKFHPSPHRAHAASLAHHHRRLGRGHDPQPRRRSADRRRAGDLPLCVDRNRRADERRAICAAEARPARGTPTGNRQSESWSR